MSDHVDDKTVLISKAHSANPTQQLPIASNLIKNGLFDAARIHLIKKFENTTFPVHMILISAFAKFNAGTCDTYGFYNEARQQDPSAELCSLQMPRS
jgi:hypothetical protein